MSTASRLARSFGLVLIWLSTVTPVPMPRTKTPARRAAETDWGKRRPESPRPKGEGTEREVSSGDEPVRGGVPRSSIEGGRRRRRSAERRGGAS